MKNLADKTASGRLAGRLKDLRKKLLPALALSGAVVISACFPLIEVLELIPEDKGHETQRKEKEKERKEKEEKARYGGVSPLPLPPPPTPSPRREDPNLKKDPKEMLEEMRRSSKERWDAIERGRLKNTRP